MSIKFMAAGYELKLKPTLREVYMAMADHADQEGRSVRPSLALIAWKVDLDIRTVRRAIRDLETMGILIQDAKGGGSNCNLWHIDLSKAERKEPYKRADFYADNLSVPLLPPGQDVRSPRTQYDPIPPDIAMSDDPSLNPSNNRHPDLASTSDAVIPEVSKQESNQEATAYKVKAVETSVKEEVKTDQGSGEKPIKKSKTIKGSGDPEKKESSAKERKTRASQSDLTPEQLVLFNNEEIKTALAKMTFGSKWATAWHLEGAQLGKALKYIIKCDPDLSIERLRKYREDTTAPAFAGADKRKLPDLRFIGESYLKWCGNQVDQSIVAEPQSSLMPGYVQDPDHPGRSIPLAQLRARQMLALQEKA